MLGTFVVLYLFLGGAGAGALFVAAVWSLLFHRTVTRTFEQSRAFRALAGRLYLVGFGLLALSAFCLLIDLGSPHRFFLLFSLLFNRIPHQFFLSRYQWFFFPTVFC